VTSRLGYRRLDVQVPERLLVLPSLQADLGGGPVDREEAAPRRSLPGERPPPRRSARQSARHRPGKAARHPRRQAKLAVAGGYPRRGQTGAAAGAGGGGGGERHRRPGCWTPTSCSVPSSMVVNVRRFDVGEHLDRGVAAGELLGAAAVLGPRRRLAAPRPCCLPLDRRAAHSSHSTGCLPWQGRCTLRMGRPHPLRQRPAATR
jgi:hypothetical protein